MFRKFCATAIICLGYPLFPKVQQSPTEPQLASMPEKERMEQLLELVSRYHRKEPKKVLHYGQMILAQLPGDEDPESEIKLRIKMAWAHMSLGANYEALANGEIAFELASQHNLEKALTGALYVTGVAHRKLGNYHRAKSQLKECYRLCRRLGLKTREANALNHLASIHLSKGELETALNFYTQAKALREELGKPGKIAASFNNIGNVYRELGAYDQAMEHYMKALRLREAVGNKRAIAESHNSIGKLTVALKEYEKALNHYFKSLQLNKEMDYKPGIAYSLHNIADVYKRNGNHNLALSHYQQSLDLDDEIGSDRGKAFNLSDMGSLFTEKGDYEKALEHLLQARSIRERLDDKLGLAETGLELARLYLKRKVPEKGIAEAKAALAGATQIKAQKVVMACYQVLSDLFAAQSDFKPAYEHYKKFREVENGLFDEEKNRTIQNLAVRFQSAKKEREIQLLKSDNRIKGMELKRQQTVRNTALAGLGGLFLLILVLSNRQAQRKKWVAAKAHNEKLKHLDKLKDEFLANTSHELRTPLNGIMGIAESLLGGSGGNLPAPVQDKLKTVYTSGKRLSHLIDDILDFSKMKSGAMKLEQTPVDLRVAVDMVFELVQPRTDAKGIDLIKDLDPDLGMVMADENRLQQILINLVGNAVKFTTKGSIKVSAKMEVNQIVVGVHDTGMGIPAADQARIFQSFQQVDGTASRTHGGTGLGLAISKRLVELQGGSIWVNSEPEQGTTFFFTLKPAHSSFSADARIDSGDRVRKSAPVDSASVPSTVVPGKTSPSEFHILIVDDEPVNRNILQDHLSWENQRVTQAEDGKRALEILAEDPTIDLILLDIMMPGMSGVEVCRQLRKSRSAAELPIIFLTAKTQLEDLVHGFNSGANDYLTKPFTKQELVARVTTQLHLRQANRRLEHLVAERTIQLKTRNDELERLDSVVEALNRNVELENLTREIFHQSLRFLKHVDRAWFFLWNPKTQCFQLAASRNIGSEDSGFYSLEKLKGRFTEKWLGEAETETAEIPEKVATKPETQSVDRLALSIGWDGHLDGLLVFENDAADAFAGLDRKMLFRFREHVVSATAKARYVEKLVDTSKRLKETQTELLGFAHRAGMAEIAANVLHDVGNALNNVCTTISLMEGELTHSKALDYLTRICNLAREHQTDWVDFLTNHPQGKNLFSHITDINQLMQNKERSLREDFQHLKKAVEDIKLVLHEQREHARDTAMFEQVDLDYLIRDLLAGHTTMLTSQKIEVHLKMQAPANVWVQRQKCLKVLNAIIINACESVVAQDHPVLRTIRIIGTLSHPMSYRLEVVDEGEGIKSENLTDLFANEYSTRDRSRGSGLHFCANAMREMSGRIQMDSDGPGLGAKATLWFPLADNGRTEPNSHPGSTVGKLNRI